MPIYEYRCHDCEAKFEALVRGGEAVACPHCGSSSLEKQLTAAAVLSGRGSPEPGRTCCGRDERCDTPACSVGSTCRHDL
jgi:putative FmdB family regulatory protein